MLDSIYEVNKLRYLSHPKLATCLFYSAAYQRDFATQIVAYTILRKVHAFFF